MSAYAALKKRTVDAWKKSAANAPTGDRFHDAVMAVHARYDVVPLLAFLRSDHALSSANRENLAGLVEMLHALGQARKGGTPGGKHLRWQKPDYIATYLVDRRIAALRQATSRAYVSAQQKEQLIDAVIGEMKGWAIMRGKKPLRRERIMDLLREPKIRRL